MKQSGGDSTARAVHIIAGFFLLAAGCASREPYPLAPEMVLLDRDAAREEYRALLTTMIPTDLPAEWGRVGVADGAEGFARAHGGLERVGADRDLKEAYGRRKRIAESFLAAVGAEYARRGIAPPPVETEAMGKTELKGETDLQGKTGARALPDDTLAIEPILPAPGAERQWPRWRGPTGQGFSAETGLPLKWSATENIAWKTEIPGSGNSSPVIWDDRIYLTTAFDEGRRRSLACVRRSDGALLFVKDAPPVPPEGRVRDKNGYASATPVVDGERVVAFLGNTGLVCFDLDGNVVWGYAMPPFDAMHGTGASPAIAGDLVFLFQEQSSKPSIAVAVDKRTGEERWQVERRSALGWSTALPLRIAGREQVLYGACEVLVSFDPRSGEELWRCGGPTHEVIPTVAYGHGLVYSASGRSGPTLAVRPTGSGDITSTGIAWRSPRGAPHVPSPVLVGDVLYLLNDTGIVTALHAKTGQTLYQKRLEGKFTASPVAAGGKVYITSEDGDTTVLEAGSEFQVVSTNPIGEPVLASAAILGGRIFLRGEKHLFAIGSSAGASPSQGVSAGASASQ